MKAVSIAAASVAALLAVTLVCAHVGADDGTEGADASHIVTGEVGAPEAEGEADLEVDEVEATGSQGAGAHASAQYDTLRVQIAAEVRTLFDRLCLMCHGGQPSAMKLDLSADTLWPEPLMVKSAQRDTIDLIVPGRPDESYLVMKIKGDARTKGNRMPPGPKPLAEEDAALLEDWVRGLAAPAAPDTAAQVAPAREGEAGGTD